MDQQKPDLEKDLYSCEYIMAKAYKNEKYCQNLYAALCNNEWIKAEMLSVLAADYWHCSWRYAGGVAAGVYDGSTYDGADNYLDFYMRGAFDDNETIYVNEGTVTDEIRDDFKRIGWYLVENGVV